MEEPEHTAEKKFKDPNLCCHYCRISRQHPRKHSVPYLSCLGCLKTYCKTCVEGYLNQNFEEIKANPSWLCPCCLGKCCCSYSECITQHNHCFTYKRTVKRHSGNYTKTAKWLKKRKDMKADEPSLRKSSRSSFDEGDEYLHDEDNEFVLTESDEALAPPVPTPKKIPSPPSLTQNTRSSVSSAKASPSVTPVKPSPSTSKKAEKPSPLPKPKKEPHTKKKTREEFDQDEFELVEREPKRRKKYPKASTSSHGHHASSQPAPSHSQQPQPSHFNQPTQFQSNQQFSPFQHYPTPAYPIQNYGNPLVPFMGQQNFGNIQSFPEPQVFHQPPPILEHFDLPVVQSSSSKIKIGPTVKNTTRGAKSLLNYCYFIREPNLTI